MYDNYPENKRWVAEWVDRAAFDGGSPPVGATHRGSPLLRTSTLLGSLFSSHTLLPYPAVSRLGLARDPAVISVVGTILTDTLALLVLAVAARMHRGEMSLLYGLELGVGSAVLIGISIYFLPRFGRWFYRNLPIGEDAAEFLFLFANLLVFSALDRTSEQWSVLENHLRDDDLLVPFSCRHDSLAWQPGLNRLPQRLRRRFPDHSMLFVYPSETASETDSGQLGAGALDDKLGPLLSADRFFPHLQAKDGEDAVREQLSRYFESVDLLPDSQLDTLTAQLLPSVLEIQLGLVILHVHCKLTAERIVLLGARPEGIDFAEIANPCYAMFILISPQDAPPEEHLRTLGKVARLIMNLPRAEILAQADREAFEKMVETLREAGKG